LRSSTTFEFLPLQPTNIDNPQFCEDALVQGHADVGIDSSAMINDSLAPVRLIHPFATIISIFVLLSL
jgi:hypothetical protein